jgi:anti-sigma factor RsiW
LRKASPIEETDVVRRELSKTEVERLFLGAVDGALAAADAATLEEELRSDPELKARFDRYRKAVGLLRGAPKEKAPEALASLILRRTRRRRFQVRARDLQAAYRVPAEVVIPLVIAVLVALFMLLASP